VRKRLLLLALLPALIFSVFIAAAIFLEYRPDDVETALKIERGGDSFDGSDLKILSWNIGYAGLGEAADFFMDGGKTSKPDNVETVRKNLEGIRKKITDIHADIVLLQEVDVMSSRSFNIMQPVEIMGDHKGYDVWFATNFRTFFVPVPVTSPMGRVWSGIMTFSKFSFTEFPRRYSLSRNENWPERLFDLKRSMLVTRIPYKRKGNEIVIINLHLSAYDDGAQREKELAFVRGYILKEYDSGNFVIAGGDWNHMLPGFDKESFGKYMTKEKDLFWVKELPPNWTPEGWKWGYGEDAATVRANDAPYKKGKTFTTVIDGFLVSPNVVIKRVETSGMEFKYSDHEPVVIEISFANEEDILKQDEALCLKGDISKCNDVGVIYRSGVVVEQNYEESYKFFKRSCNGGFKEGCFNLALAYEGGWGTRHDFVTASELYEKVCEEGLPQGCYSLSVMYLSGKEVNRNFKKAYSLLKRACDGDHIWGCYNLGVMYSRGEGVAQDHTTAFSLYKKVCDSGDNWGCYNMGGAYFTGRGVDKNYDAASGIYKKICSTGDMEACYNLGIIYMRGAGVEKNIMKAVEFFKEACHGGVPDACKKIVDINF
jgi:TPR repeat protein/endonuclease/exonuclease/phosphatase family metal-dependent hydrolase